MDLEPRHLEECLLAVRRFSSLRLAVVGDLVVDEHVYGQTSRVSREAPVLILKETKRMLAAGGAGNAFLNVKELGAWAKLFGAVGADPEAQALVESFEWKGFEVDGIVASQSYLTPRLTRIWAGSHHTSHQQVIRLDREGHEPIDRAAFDRLLEALCKAFDKGLDGVLLSDYARGAIPEAWRGELLSLLIRAKVPVFVDARNAFTEYKGASYFLPSEAEVEGCLGVRLNSDPAAIEQAGFTLLQALGEKTKALVMTLGSMGMAVFEPGNKAVFLKAVGKTEVTDVTGAGDTVTAVFALASLAGLSPVKAAILANIAGGIVVMKRGCAQVTQEELAQGVVHAFA